MNQMLAKQSEDDAIAVVLDLPRPVPPVLAVGAFLKNTLCLANDRAALVSRDVGNLESVGAVRDFQAYAERLLTMAGDLPVAVAHDLHPDFHSTRWAEAFSASMGVEAVPVQHHHAHVAAVMAEHGIEEPTLGLALDGFGLGPNNEAWGGELLRVDADGYRRLGHLAPLVQPGGDRAAREPWRMGAAALFALGRGDEITVRYAEIRGAEVIARMLRQNINCPPTSSCGRLFDAACGLLGIKPFAAFEGEAPMELERLATDPEVDSAGWRLQNGVLDLLPLLDHLTDSTPKHGANLFHGTLAAAMAEWVSEAAQATGICRVALSGGCFLNRVLTESLVASLQRDGLTVLQPIRLKPGDSAVSLGQAWAVAMARR
ncbi:MAG: carbamoyltransferase HypF [Hyphomicrobiales bacterium]